MTREKGSQLDIWEIALGFMDAQVLLTADELGLFQILQQETGLDELTRRMALPADSVERLLSCLCAMRLTRKTEQGRFVNSPQASEQLVAGQPGYIGGMFKYLRTSLYPVWQHLPEGLREQSAQWARAFPEGAPTEQMYSDSEKLREFMDGMYSITHGPAAEFARQAPELKEISTLVDVGGASGAFAIALAEELPDACLMVLDLPAVQPLAEENFRKSGRQDNLRFLPGNFWEDPLPPAADAYALGFILHDWDDAGGDLLLGKVAQAAKPGSLLIVGEYLLNEDLTGPLFVARQSLNMLMSARGKERSAAQYAEWLRRFGFELKNIYPTPGGKQYMVAAYAA